jgi:hypothetical protein
MHSQPAVIFKRKGSTFAVLGILALAAAIIGSFCLIRQTATWTAAGAVMMILALGFSARVLMIFSRPYIHLTDNQVTVYRGVFPTPTHYSLLHIHGAHTNHPETYIELIGRDASDSIRIDLHPLDKADRIRFIFLVESSINRKFSHQHSKAAQSVE